MVLREGTTAATPAPLAQEISFDDTMDRGWLELSTRGFIERAETKVESGSSEGQTKEDWIKSTLTITVTDPAWVAHLTVGQEFDSHSFDAASDFVGSIGKAELIPGKRLGSRLKLSRMLGNLEPKVLSAVVAGDSTTFRIAVPPANTSLESLSDDQLIALGFQLVRQPAVPEGRWAADAALALAVLVHHRARGAAALPRGRAADQHSLRGLRLTGRALDIE